MIQGAALVGKITAAGQLIGAISAKAVLVGSMAMPVGYIDYTDSYEVIPTVEEQALLTKDRHMTDNVTIKAIPYAEVSNVANGKTVTIA